MESDPEKTGSFGGSYTTMFRQYDPRVGRWLTLDPLMGKFPHLSPYVAFNDNPIYFADPNGLEGEEVKMKVTYRGLEFNVTLKVNSEGFVKEITFDHLKTVTTGRGRKKSTEEYHYSGTYKLTGGQVFFNQSVTVNGKKAMDVFYFQGLITLDGYMRYDNKGNPDYVNMDPYAQPQRGEPLQIDGETVTSFDILVVLLQQNDDLSLVVVGNESVTHNTPEGDSPNFREGEVVNVGENFQTTDYSSSIQFTDDTNADGISGTKEDFTLKRAQNLKEYLFRTISNATVISVYSSLNENYKYGEPGKGQGGAIFIEYKPSEEQRSAPPSFRN